MIFFSFFFVFQDYFVSLQKLFEDMRIITSEELRKIQLDLLQKTADFCESNGLRYFLCGGTLIGAVRHKGYIPWDDDIDIAMPRSDYEKFISIFNRPQNYYQVMSFETNPDYAYAFAKVYDNRTILKELHYKGTIGAYIDVFPADAVKDAAQIRKIMLLHKVLNTKRANYYHRTLSKMIINSLGKLLLLPFSAQQIARWMDSEARKYAFGSLPTAGGDISACSIRRKWRRASATSTNTASQPR